MAAARRSHKIRVFESAIEKLGRILSQKWKIKVVFKHGECKTTGNVIYLPVLPDNASQELMDAMQGHLDHETAHVIFTDFKAFQNIKRRDKKLFTLTNALEDPRIEKKMTELWRGSGVNLKRSLEWSLQKVREVRDVTDPDGKVQKVRPWENLSDFGKLAFTAAVFAQSGFKDDHWFIQEVVEPDIFARVKQCEDILREAVESNDTNQVVDLAGKFLKRVNEEEDPDDLIDPKDIPDNAQFFPPRSPQDATMQKQPSGPKDPSKIELEFADEEDEKDEELMKKAVPMPGGKKPSKKKKAAKGPAEDEDTEEESVDDKDDPDSEKGAGKSSKEQQGAGDEGEEDDEDGDGTAAGEAEDGENDDPGSTPRDGEPDEEEDGDEVPGSGSNTPRKAQPKRKPLKPRDFDPKDKELQMDAALLDRGDMLAQAATHELKGTDSYLVYTTEGDQIEVIRDGDRVKYKDFMMQANAMVSVIKRKMSRNLLATNVSRWEGDKVRGKLNPRAIFRVPIGTSKRVFRTKVESEDFDTAVQIMVDHSGSMGGEKLDLAAKTSIILGEVCNQLNIPFSVLGFSTGNSSQASERYHHATQPERELYSRWGNLWIGVYKEFDEMWASNNHKIINMVRNARINTYDGESLRFGAQRLLGRPEKRKILFWLNDGMPEPNSCDDHDAHCEFAAACGKEVEKKVEMIAVGIMTDQVRNYYSNYVVVNDLEDLPSTCLNKLDELLRKGKRLVPVGGMRLAK